MEWAIFPSGGLDSSVITTVWVGVCVMSLLNLRLGWTYSGLVVPGYLVPLMIARPWAAGVIILEGIVTYGLIWLYSEQLSKLRLWPNLFGRDRFLVIILASVIVRIGGETFVLPVLGEYLTQAHGLAFDYRSHFHSFGLVIVALFANQLGKPGLVRGLAIFSAQLGLTFAIVRGLLIPWTNFSVGSLAYMYEDVATSLLASPKSYIVLIIAAAYASYSNLRYGWNTRGILVPSLLALMIFQPGKLLTTFVEAWVVLAASRLLLMTPILRERNIANARLMLLFWNVSFAYKMLLGFALAAVAPGFKVSDAYGFSYLLPTLLALAMHESGRPLRLPVLTLWLSLFGAMAGGIVGWSLTWVDGPQGRTASYEMSEAATEERLQNERARLLKEFHENNGVLPEEIAEREGDLARWLRLQGDAVAPPETPDLRLPRLGELLFFDREILTPLVRRDSDALVRATRSAALVGYELSRFKDFAGETFLVLAENSASTGTGLRGWGTYVFREVRKDNGAIAVQVPRPLMERGTLTLGVDFFLKLNADVFLLTGAHGGNAGMDVTSDSGRRHLFNLVNQVWLRETEGEQLAVQVRGMEGAPADALLADAGTPPASLLESLHAGLADEGYSWRPVDGSTETAGYGADHLFQTRYVDLLDGKGVAVLWFSPKHRGRSWEAADDARFAMLGITDIEGELADFIPGDGEGFASDLLEHYQRSRDISALRALQRQGLELRRLEDTHLRRSFLIALENDRVVAATPLR